MLVASDVEAPSGRLAAARVVTAVILVVIGFAFIQRMNGWIWPQALFDARVFVRALAQIRAGHGPYDLIWGPHPDLDHLPLVYPPTVAWPLQAIAATGVPLGLVAGLIYVLVFAGMAAGVVASVRLFSQLTASRIALAVGLFATFIGGGGMIAVVTGNVSSLFWGMALAACVPGFGQGRWAWFHAAVFVTVLFKPYFVALWIIPVMATGWSWRQFWIGAALAAMAGAIYAAVMAARPDLTAGWLATLANRVAAGDDGSSIYALLRHHIGDKPTLVVAAAYTLVLLAMVLFSRTQGPMRQAALIAIAIAANPRLNAYDFCYAAVPAYYVYSTRLGDLIGRTRGAWLSLSAAVVVGVISCALYLQFSWTGKAFLVVFLAGVVGLASQWSLVARWLPGPNGAADKAPPTPA